MFLLRFFKKFTIFLLFIATIWLIYFKIYGNFHQVDNNFYRSAQLYSFNMPYYLKKYQIKTIINLRGKSQEDWYKDEIKISKDLNITHIDFGFSDRKILPISKMKQLVEIIKDAKKPLLVHCKAGADRTSLATALYLYEVKKSANAKSAISIIYGHFPWLGSRTKAMDISFENYIKESR